MYQRAQRRAREILETHVPEPLPDDVRQRLRTIVADADRGLAGA
jgi:trimethylamine:corrinoid methyltransferase-like protein